MHAVIWQLYLHQYVAPFPLAFPSNPCRFSTVAGTKDFAGAGFDTLKRILTHMQVSVPPVA
jgi:hypothetical protein